MKITMRKLATLKPYVGNPRIDDTAVVAVVESIRQFGFRQPIVIDADDVIVCGHTRWIAAQKLGLAEVPVHVAHDLTPEQIRAYRIADNKTAELSEWNYDLLSVELEAIIDSGIAPESLGFLPIELRELAGDVLDLGEAPETVREEAQRISEIANAHHESNKAVAGKWDTEKYIVIVYPSRAAKVRALIRLGLSEDERYVPASSVTLLKVRTSMAKIKAGKRSTKISNAKHTGACG